MINHWIEKIYGHRWSRHLTFWILYMLFSILYGMGFGQLFLVALILMLIKLPAQILATYCFLYFQLPLLYKKKYLLFSILFLPFVYVFGVMMHINNDLGIGTRLISWHEPHDLKYILTDFSLFIRSFVDVYLAVFIALGAKLISNKSRVKKELEILAADKAKAELQLLQTKVNPEYVLEALKNIERTSRDQIEKVPEMISELSEILDKTLYQNDNKTNEPNNE